MNLNFYCYIVQAIGSAPVTKMLNMHEVGVTISFKFLRRINKIVRNHPICSCIYALETSSAFSGRKKYLIQIPGIGPINYPYNFKSDKGGHTLRNNDNTVIKQAHTDIERKEGQKYVEKGT